MADSGSTGKKRKLSARSAAPKSSEAPVQSSSLTINIPTDTNTSLPVWDALRSQQADVTWTVQPYSVHVHLTPVSKEPENVKASTSDVSFSVQIQHHVTPENTSGVQLSLFHNTQSAGHAPKSPPSNPSTSLVPVHQPATITSTKVPGGPPSELQAQPFCTKTPTGVLICDDFLLGSCQKGEACTMHHTPYPYHWQLMTANDNRWIDVAPRSQVLLERLYCDADQDTVTLKDGETCTIVTFDPIMNVIDWSQYEEIRRLTNSRSTKQNPHFPSKWKLYWCNNEEQFVEYEKDISTMLLKKKKKKEKTFSFQMGTQKYTMDFTSMTQTNDTTGYKREVRYRPVYRSPESLLPHLRTGILPDGAMPDGDVPGDNFSLDPLEEFTSWYPPVWSQDSDQDYLIVNVPMGTRVYQRVSGMFHQSLPESKTEIISIEQIQNLFQWDKYQRQKTHMQKQSSKSQEPLERHLFHGTTAGASKGICHNNFDPRLSGVNGYSHGHGTYFATKAWLSDAYTGVVGSQGVRHVFLAKVLVGRVTMGKQRYRRPPPISSKLQPHVFYDACVDSMDNPGVFVIFDSCQCYPYYLIKYRTLPTEIPVK